VTLRSFGGTPTYGLSDNEKTLTVDHIACIAVRHPTMVAVGRHYGLTFASCVTADPQSKGGSEATVRIASADLVPTDANLLPDHSSYLQFRRRVSASATRSTRGRIVPRVARRSNGWRPNVSAFTRYRRAPTRRPSA
jgi:transposase